MSIYIYIPYIIHLCILSYNAVVSIFVSMDVSWGLTMTAVAVILALRAFHFSHQVPGPSLYHQ